MEFDERQVRAAMQDEGAALVMQACIAKCRSAKDISFATGTPLVTVYRQIKRLSTQGLLNVERSAMTATGKTYDLYRCPLEWAGVIITHEGLKVQWKARRPMSERLHDLWRQMEERK